MMNSRLAVAFAAGAVAFGAMAGESESGWAYNPGEGLSFDETPIVKAEFGLAFDSKYLTYGVTDGKDPILTPSATVTFLDWAYLGVESIFDLTKGNGKYGEYGNRAGKWTTLDAIVGLAHEFELNDDGLKLSVSADYKYEYIHRHHSDMGDTQYLEFELGLSGLYLEPVLTFERDIMADEGTYVNFALGHTIDIIGEGDEAELTFTPSIGQGFGDKHRTRGYDLARDHGGVMDTCIKGEFEYKVNDNVKLGAYLAYYDYWFDRSLRHGARDYNDGAGDAHNSYNFQTCIGVTVAF